MKTKIIIFALLPLLLLVNGCKKEINAKKVSNKIVSNYIYAYTGGIISRESKVRIQFTNTIVNSSLVGQKIVGGILTISPSINGNAYWEDDHTIVFEPDPSFQPNTLYKATVFMKRIYKNVPKEIETFEFNFRTREMFLELKTDGIEPMNASNLNVQTLSGKVISSDIAEENLLQKCLNASQNGKALPVTWTHSPDLLVHHFLIKDINRTTSAEKIVLQLKGAPLDIKTDIEKVVEIPEIGVFKIMDVNVGEDDNQVINVEFSDPILPNQELEGLFTISNYKESLKYSIDGNTVRIYPSTRMTGEHTVFVTPSIKNSNNKSLTNDQNWTISFNDVNPQLRLKGNGVILPNSDGLLFPFEAINLTDVELEVFKIYNNNILQFLQTNELSEKGDMERVGRVIIKKRIPLRTLNPSAKSQIWTKYYLDLSQIINQDPAAIYQIRIGFLPSYTSFNCGGNTKKKDLNLIKLNKEIEDASLGEDDEIKSMFDNYYGISEDEEGGSSENNYSYEHRENPCFPEYYNSEHFIKGNLFASNIGVIGKKGNDGSLFLAVSNLKTTDPIADATVEFYDDKNQLLTTTKTDADGFVFSELVKKTSIVIVTNGVEKGYLKLNEYTSNSMTRYEVDGVQPQKGLKGYIYGERGVWRPGDSLYLNFVLNDLQNKLPANYPIVFELKDPRNQTNFKKVYTANVNNVYPIHISTSPDAPTGNWIANIKVGGAQYSKTLKIETVKPNRLKINFDFGKPQLDINDRVTSAKLHVNWLTGLPANSLRSTVEMQIAKDKTEFPKYKDFVFTDPSQSFTNVTNTIFDAKLNETGDAKVNLDLNKTANFNGMMKLNFTIKSFENGGDFSTDNYSIPFSPNASYCGIKIPKNRYGEPRITRDKDGFIEIAVVDKSGNPIPNRKVSTSIYKASWRWWWDYDGNNNSDFNNTSSMQLLKNEFVTTESNGIAKLKVNISDYGRFFVQVIDLDSKSSAGDFFYTEYPYGDNDDENANNQKKELAMLSISSPKKTYKVGEMVEVNIPSGNIGRMLITLENGSRVLKSFWREAKSGDNKIAFEATSDMAPTIYAYVSLLQPHAQTINDLPIRMYGVVPIEILDTKTILTPQIKMAEVIKPETNQTIDVSERTGKPMAYTLSIVDEGLLDLTRFKTPNAHEAFYAKEALGVTSHDLYDQVIGAYGSKLERVLSVGGDLALKKSKNAIKANRFVPVVQNFGPYYIPANGHVSHNINIKNYVGSVRVMVVACSKNSYGSTEKTVPVKKPLMILPTLPRVIGPGEEINLPIDVFAMENKIKSVNLKLTESSGLVSLIDAASKTIGFTTVGDKIVNYKLKVGNKTGVAKFSFAASGNGESANSIIEVQVRNPNPYITNVKDKFIEANADFVFDTKPIGESGTNKVVLEVSTLPPMNLQKNLDYLIHYPYGCIEQTTSAAFPQLYVDRFINLDAKRSKEIKTNVEAALTRLKNFQTPGGGFSYWPGEENPSYWGTNYAGHFLMEAKNKGYTLPANMLERFISFQQKIVKRWNPDLMDNDGWSYESSANNQAYSLYNLALAKSPEIGSMNRLIEYPKLNTAGKWRLAAAYALIGKIDIARNIISKVNTTIIPYRELAFTYGSDLRDKAIILETLSLLKEKEKGLDILKEISGKISNNGWYSTQDIAYCLMSIGKFLGGNKIDSKFTFDYTLNGKLTNAGAATTIKQIEMNGEISNKLLIKNTSTNGLFVRVISTGQSLTGDNSTASNNLKMVVAYQDMKGNKLNPTSINQGTDFYVVVNITNPGTRGINYKEMVLNQVFPSGWEIHNLRMGNTEMKISSNTPEYQDIRDDRVNTFFDIDLNKMHTYVVKLNATYPGRYYLPSVTCEAMYDKTISARQPGTWVNVIPNTKNL
jgi:alpha-2-macroglobulin